MESGHDDSDYQLALKLQAEINAEDADVSDNETVDNEEVFALDMTSSKPNSSNNTKNNNKKNNKDLNKDTPPSVNITQFAIQRFLFLLNIILMYVCSARKIWT